MHDNQLTPSEAAVAACALQNWDGFGLDVKVDDLDATAASAIKKLLATAEGE